MRANPKLLDDCAITRRPNPVQFCCTYSLKFIEAIALRETREESTFREEL
jgi:hypothetical protein